jgi:hypothetical protein
LWLSLAEKGIKRGYDVDVIREAIFAGDNTITQIASRVKSHPILRITVFENSCDGFIQFARRTVK